MLSWIIIFIILLIIEILTVNLITIWFAVGALGAIITSIFTDSILIQTLIFILVSILSLIITKPLIKKFKLNEKEPTNLDMVIGKTAIVIKDIKPLENGEVKIDGKIWTATSDENIKKDSKVEILAIDGVKLKVISKEEIK